MNNRVLTSRRRARLKNGSLEFCVGSSLELAGLMGEFFCQNDTRLYMPPTCQPTPKTARNKLCGKGRG